MEIDVVVTPGLGDNSYLLVSGDEAALVDPQRDVDRFLTLAESRNVKIRHVLETHVHNDYISGAVEIREATGAEIDAPAAGRYEFPHRGLGEGDEVKVGDLTLTAMETPGHTPEHLSYSVRPAGEDRPVAVFTGGSLMVGGAGRTDLVGPDLTDRLTRAQYRTLRRLSALPGDVQVLPTHGAGSFCGAGPASEQRVSTVAEELRGNRALAAPDEDSFARQQLAGLLAYPTYYREMAAINRAGPRSLSDVPRVPGLGSDRIAAGLEAGTWVIDARWGTQFARAHIPGALNFELDDTFGSYVGWVVPFGDPLSLILPDPTEESLEAAVTQLLRIGYERVEGYLEGGMQAWRAAGRPVASYRVAGLHELCRAWSEGRVAHLLDVRQRAEWDDGHVAGSRHLFVGDILDRLDQIPRDGEVWTICASGHRASLATSILEREGVPVRLVEGTGVRDFMAHCLPRREP